MVVYKVIVGMISHFEAVYEKNKVSVEFDQLNIQFEYSTHHDENLKDPLPCFYAYVSTKFRVNAN